MRYELSHALDPQGWVYNDWKTTRLLTDAELGERGILRCASADSREENQVSGVETARVVLLDETTDPPAPTVVVSTTKSTIVMVAAAGVASAESGPGGVTGGLSAATGEPRPV